MMELRPHGVLIVMRLLFAAAIAAALPMSHLWWGYRPQEEGIDGPVAFGFLLVFLGISTVVALLFVTIASIVHLFLRGRPRVMHWIDSGLAMTLVALLVWGGAAATY